MGGITNDPREVTVKTTREYKEDNSNQDLGNITKIQKQRIDIQIWIN